MRCVYRIGIKKKCSAANHDGKHCGIVRMFFCGTRKSYKKMTRAVKTIANCNAGSVNYKSLGI